jgi:protein-S-isoprenylcysteine O-methyltransferase Ste14
MTDIARRPSSFPWPPLVYVAAVAISIALWILYPLPWFGSPLSDIFFAGGWIVVIASMAMHISAIRTLSRANTTAAPNKGSEHLVTSGPFSFTRNPIYLANTLLMVGVAMISGIAWFILLAVIAAFITQKLAIEREEKHLEARFGKKYFDYKKRVRRWV